MTFGNIIRVTLVFAIAIVIAFGVFFCISFVADGQVMKFYVRHNSHTFKSTTSSAVDVELGKAYVFHCFEMSGTGDYNIFVVPSADCDDFDFTVNGRQMKFKNEVDLTQSFLVERFTGGFVIYFESDLDIAKVLEGVYGKNKVQLPSGVKLSKNLSLVIVPVEAEPVTIVLDFGGAV